jgi:hypothetical protein
MIPPLSDIPDYYTLLGVAPDASSAEITGAFQQVVTQYHPDLFAGNPSVRWDAELFMAEVTAAYDVLSDRARRQQYDLQRLELTDWQQAVTIPLYAEAADDTATWTTLPQPEQPIPSFHLNQPPQIMGALSKAMLLPTPFCAAMVIATLLTAVISYPLILIPPLLRLRQPIFYRPLLSLQQKLLWTPVILLLAMLLSWIWITGVDHNGKTMNALDLYWWCGLLLSVCISLAYL